MAAERVGGIIFFKINGEQYRAKGSFTTNLGRPKREAVVGADGVHGYKEMPQVPFIEGEITDSAQLNMEALVTAKDATVVLEFANGKVHVLRDAFYAAEGNLESEEGNIEVRFEGLSAEEIR
jgi:hypothetical protein